MICFQLVSLSQKSKIQLKNLSAIVLLTYDHAFCLLEIDFFFSEKEREKKESFYIIKRKRFPWRTRSLLGHSTSDNRDQKTVKQCGFFCLDFLNIDSISTSKMQSNLNSINYLYSLPYIFSLVAKRTAGEWGARGAFFTTIWEKEKQKSL